MENYTMTAQFYPAKEPVNGFIGNADLYVSDVIKLRGISVFENKEKDGLHMQFPGFKDGEGKNNSYIQPSSKEAYARMLDVVTQAVNDPEKHHGFVPGKKKVPLSVSGRAVDEPFADARFNLKIGDLCTISNITTHEATVEKDGNKRSFVSVDAPNLPPYEKNGEKIYPPIFEGLKSSYVPEGQDKPIDFGRMIQSMVKAERNKALGKAPLEAQMENAAQKAGHGEAHKDAPAKAAER